MPELLSNLYFAWGVAGIFSIFTVALIIYRYITLQKEKNQIQRITSSDLELFSKQSAKELAGRRPEIYNLYNRYLRQLESADMSEVTKRRLLTRLLQYLDN
jgi:competence protein ComGF